MKAVTMVVIGLLVVLALCQNEKPTHTRVYRFKVAPSFSLSKPTHPKEDNPNEEEHSYEDCDCEEECVSPFTNLKFKTSLSLLLQMIKRHSENYKIQSMRNDEHILHYKMSIQQSIVKFNPKLQGGRVFSISINLLEKKAFFIYQYFTKEGNYAQVEGVYQIEKPIKVFSHLAIPSQHKVDFEHIDRTIDSNFHTQPLKDQCAQPNEKDNLTSSQDQDECSQSECDEDEEQFEEQQKKIPVKQHDEKTVNSQNKKSQVKKQNAASTNVKKDQDIENKKIQSHEETKHEQSIGQDLKEQVMNHEQSFKKGIRNNLLPLTKQLLSFFGINLPK